MLRSRFILVCLLLCLGTSAHATPPMNAAALATIDRATLSATQRGDILSLEPYLAPNFQASIKVPTDQGQIETLLFSREEFLLYAWQALIVAQAYQAHTRSAEYKIAHDGSSAVGTSTLDESVSWQNQPLRYTTQRTTHYRPGERQIQITRLEVQVLKWDQP